MKRVLYLGLEAPSNNDCTVIHFPVIRIIPEPTHSPKIQQAFKELSLFTHIVFTSKTAVNFFFQFLKELRLNIESPENITFIAVGQATAKAIQNQGFQTGIIAQEESAEGLVKELTNLNLKDSYLFWPHSALSRSVISDYLQQNGIHYLDCVFYNTIFQQPTTIPDLKQIDEIVFTSSSTVDAFFQIYKNIPKEIKISCIGKITQNYFILKTSA